MRHVFGPGESTLNPLFTFARFVPGEENRAAYAAVLALTEEKSPAPNVVHIVGEVGSGKTHLLQAAVQHAANRNVRSKPIYVTASELRDVCTRKSRARFDILQQALSAPQLLALDDIEFLGSEPRVHIALAKIISERTQRCKKTIVSSKLGEQTAANPGHWGENQDVLCVELSLPSLATQTAIVRTRSEEEGWNIPEYLVKYIASKAMSSVRCLEHTLSKVVVSTEIRGIDVAHENPERYEQFIRSVSLSAGLTPEIIKSCVALFFDIPSSLLEGPRSSRVIAQAKELAIYLIREYTSASFAKISSLLGERNYSVVMHAYSRASTMAYLPIYRKQIADIEALIKASGSIVATYHED